MDREKFEQICNKFYGLIQQDRDEFFWLVNKVESVNPKVIIEIGVYVGGTLAVWELLLPKGGLLIGIDKVNPKDAVRWDWKKSDRILALIHGNSRDPQTITKVKNALNGKLADFLFIDATHDSESVRQDFQNYVPFVRSGGLVGFHDINECRRFFNNLVGRRDEITKRIGTGCWWKE